MVCLSAALLSKTKTLVARQFVEMSRLRVEGLLGAFPKLVDSGKDHTYIETESVRYVYQPMEALFLVLVTNKSSNILEDLETLRLLAKVVQNCCQIQVNEENVIKHAFDVVFAFDEVISFGQRESATLSQIKTYIEMDSHEEKSHQIIEQSKINEARENAKKKQLELAKIRMTMPSSKMRMSNNGVGMDGGVGSGMASGIETPGVDSRMGWMPANSMKEDDGPAPVKGVMPKRGMVLGNKQPASMRDMMKIFGPDSGPTPGDAAQVVEAAPAAPVNALKEPATVMIEEKITANLHLEGGIVGEAECLGQFVVTVNDTSKADLVCFKLAEQDQRFKYRAHPSLNKVSQANNILEVRDASKAFKANVPTPLIKWRHTSSKDDILPIQLSCWPSTTAEGTQVVLEYELTNESITLQDCHARFPCPPDAQATVSSADNGEAQYESHVQQLHWYIPVITKNEASGSVEFFAKMDISMMLPFTFEATVVGKTMCPMSIVDCYHQASNTKIEYAEQLSTTYTFTVGA
jgi:hypothetical protein